MKMNYSPIVLALTLSFFASVGLASIRSFTVKYRADCDPTLAHYLFITPEYANGSIVAGCTVFMDRSIPNTSSSSYKTWLLPTELNAPDTNNDASRTSCTYTFQVDGSNVQKFITLDENTPSNASIHVTTANGTDDECDVKNVCLSTSEGCS